MVLHAIAVASVKLSCESILENFVSQYGNHFDEHRNVSEEAANEEHITHAHVATTKALEM